MAAPTPIPFLEDVPAGSSACLSIFGKHPSAADHMEDLGLATQSLVAFKQGFYVDGIGGALVKQTWLRDLGATESVPYDHAMLCIGRGGWLAVRFNHSSDAPGRRQFPLVVAVHGTNLMALNAAEDMGCFVDLQLQAAIGASDSPGLRQVLTQGQERLGTEIRNWCATANPTESNRVALIDQPRLQPERQGLWRICHALSPKGAGAGRARVPIDQPHVWEDMVLWASFAKVLLDGQSPLITVVSGAGQGYADLYLGPPGARVLASLFAKEASIPLTCDVPFNVSAEVQTNGLAVVQTWRDAPQLFPPAPPPVVGNSPTLLEKVCNGFGRWFK